MSATGDIDLWQLFVDAGLRVSEELERGVGELRPDTVHLPDIRASLQALAYNAFAIASQSLLLGEEPTGRLAHACERCLDHLRDGTVIPEHILPLLASAVYTLRQAFHSFTQADRSGARTDSRPLLAARYELEAAFPGGDDARATRGLSAQTPDVPLSALTRRPAKEPVTEPVEGGLESAYLASIRSGDGFGGRSQKRGGSSAGLPVLADSLSGALSDALTVPGLPVPVEADDAAPEAAIWVPSVAEDMVELFFDEVDERIEGLSLTLIDVEQHPDDKELIRSIFRDLHTIKGSSAMVGLQPMNTVAHAAEDLVGHLRDGDREVDSAIVDALLAAIDALRDIAALARTGQRLDFDLEPVMDHLRNPHKQPVGQAAALPTGSTLPPPPSSPNLHGAAVPEVIPARKLADSTTSGPATPGLAREGAITQVVQAASRQTIRVDFDKLDRLMNLVGELVLGRDGLRTSLNALSAVTDEMSSERMLTRRLLAVRRILQRRIRAVNGRRRSIEHEMADLQAHKQSIRQNIRELSEELGRVERVLIEITQDLDYASSRLDSVSGDLREQVMKLRMVPVGGIFRKHHRTVRDLSTSLGKKVRLKLVGEDTELDKLLVEALDEPLMHLVRNAVDHGIEAPDDRLAADKDPEGTITLSALHRGNQVVVQIADDGRGIDPDKLRQRARERGLIDAEEDAALAALDESDRRELLELIFRPGFSTAAQVSQVSGRGVGMDVVRQTIVSKLKGTVDIDSDYGRGTVFTLRMPLTLAIIQVLLARASGEVFAIPLDHVIRTISAPLRDIRLVQDREVISERGRQLPIIRLSTVLKLDPPPYTEDALLQLVITEYGGDTFGLMCDHLIGKKEIVIKPLGPLLQNVPCAAGATLLGERCALILDVPAIIRRALHHGLDAPPPPVAAQMAIIAGNLSDQIRPHVLLVDDSDTVRESLRRLITNAGYRCTTAGDGLEGLSQAMRQRFDLVSTDVMMPRMDGYEFTRRLRALADYKNTPIVMVTSRGERIDRVRGFDAGVDEYITKPHDRQLLIRTIRALLDQPTASSSPGPGPRPLPGDGADDTGAAGPGRGDRSHR